MRQNDCVHNWPLRYNDHAWQVRASHLYVLRVKQTLLMYSKLNNWFKLFPWKAYPLKTILHHWIHWFTKYTLRLSVISHRNPQTLCCLQHHNPFSIHFAIYNNGTFACYPQRIDKHLLYVTKHYSIRILFKLMISRCVGPWWVQEWQNVYLE